MNINSLINEPNSRDNSNSNLEEQGRDSSDNNSEQQGRDSSDNNSEQQGRDSPNNNSGQQGRVISPSNSEGERWDNFSSNLEGEERDDSNNNSEVGIREEEKEFSDTNTDENDSENKIRYDKEDTEFIRTVAEGTGNNCVELNTRLSEYQDDLIDDGAVDKAGIEERERLLDRDYSINSFAIKRRHELDTEGEDKNTKRRAVLDEIALRSMVDTNTKTDSLLKSQNNSLPQEYGELAEHADQAWNHYMNANEALIKRLAKEERLGKKDQSNEKNNKNSKDDSDDNDPKGGGSGLTGSTGDTGPSSSGDPGPSGLHRNKIDWEIISYYIYILFTGILDSLEIILNNQIFL